MANEWLSFKANAAEHKEKAHVNLDFCHTKWIKWFKFPKHSHSKLSLKC